MNVDEKELDEIVGGNLNTDKNETVPNVIGMSLLDAEEKLISKGFSVDYKYAKSDKPKDVVILTDPLCGIKAPKFSKVILTLSNGE